MKKLFIVTLLASYSSSLYSGDNFELGDAFIDRHSKAKEVYNTNIAKNRSMSHLGDGSSYKEINGKEEFKKAMESGELGEDVNGNGVNKVYRAIDIKNVRLNKSDFDKKKDKLLIGSKITKDNQQLNQVINIKNSKIETDKKVNIGVVSSAKRVNGINTFNNIENSSIKGKKDSSENKSRMELFEELERANKE